MHTAWIALAVIGAAFVEQAQFLAIRGVNPSVVFVMLILLADSVDDWVLFLGLGALGAAIVKSTPGFEWASLVIIVISGGIWIGARILPWHGVVNGLVVIIVAITTLYGIIDWTFIVRNSATFGMVLGYTAMLLLIGYGIYGKQH